MVYGRYNELVNGGYIARNLHGLFKKKPVVFDDTVARERFRSWWWEPLSLLMASLEFPTTKKTAAKGMVLAVSLWDTWSLYFRVLSTKKMG